MEVFIVSLIALAVAIACLQHADFCKRRDAMQAELKTLEDFDATQTVIGKDGQSGLAVDELRQRVCLITHSDKSGVSLDVCSYGDLLAAEIFEDGRTITQTSRGGQLGGAVIGGLVLGGVGAIIGGLSAKQVATEKVHRIDLRITVNRTAAPLHDINFMDHESSKGEPSYNLAMKEARHWHGLLSVLMKRADDELRSRPADFLLGLDAPRSSPPAATLPPP